MCVFGDLIAQHSSSTGGRIPFFIVADFVYFRRVCYSTCNIHRPTTTLQKSEYYVILQKFQNSIKPKPVVAAPAKVSWTDIYADDEEANGNGLPTYTSYTDVSDAKDVHQNGENNRIDVETAC